MKRKALKICCAVLAFIIIGFILYITFSFTGNPISKIIIANTSKNYIEKTYPELDLDIKSPVYNFKFSNYSVHCQSKISSDINFSVYFSWDGKLISDNYDSYVTSGFNTLQRINNQYQKDIESLLKSNLKYDYDYILTDLTTSENLPLDFKYDIHSNKINSHIRIYLYSNDRTWNNIAKSALEIDNLMKQNNIKVKTYSIILQNPKSKPDSTYEGELKYDSLSLYDFPSELLTSDNLPQVMETFYNNWEIEMEKK